MWNLDTPNSSQDTIQNNKNSILDKISEGLQKEKIRRRGDEYHKCIINRRVLLCKILELSNENDGKIPDYLIESQDKILTELSPSIDYDPSKNPDGFNKLADMTHIWGAQVLPGYGWKTPTININTKF